ncbi:MAG: SDR family NAD(P)-dependent oxidoreductase [Elusimicrobiaceae bacterium]|nr:SDR family NAD(P)-dependent oxidoreductase [Elusimicrobiaceae bacterium]
MNKNLEPIAVIGIGAIMPGALNKEEYWQNIINGKNCITEVPKEKWDSSLFYSADRTAPDKTYSKIGGFITGYKFNSLKYKIPPAIAKQMDSVQCLALDIAQMALEDSGYDKKDFDRKNTAVIIANSVGGMKNEYSNVRIYKAFYYDMLKRSDSFKTLPQTTKDEILKEVDNFVNEQFLPINEDTMPGELPNVIAGRIANVFNLNGANFAIDAACASSLAALDQAVNGLRAGEYNMVLCGGVDQMMSPASYIRFCKIGALSATGSYAFDARANGFVMAEGAGMVILKRLSDAVKDGDKIYGVIRSIGSSSDGKGKGITAPNPKGQMIAINRAFEQVEFDPSQVTLMEAHGTATKVGDATELGALNEVFAPYAKPGTIGLGSVKSQIGHTKSAAGMASLIKVMFALKNKVLPPSINFETPNPIVDWAKSPFKVITKTMPWQTDKVRTAAVSAFGFGGANFHLLAQEYDPSKKDFKQEPVKTICCKQEKEMTDIKTDYKLMVPVEKLQGDMLIFSGDTKQDLFNNLNEVVRSVKQENYFLTLLAYKTHTQKHKKFAVSINAENPDKLKEKIAFFIKTATGTDVWAEPSLYLKMKGIYPFTPTTDKPKVCFMFPGQGAQYVDMMKDLASKYKIVRDTFAQADKILKEIIGSTLTDTLWSKEGESKEDYKKREEAIKQTQITQPAILTCNVAMMRLLYQFGLKPDVTMGHSLGEYGAAVASGILNFEDAIKAVTIRGSVMANIELEDTGKMAAVSASVETIEPELAKISGYVAVANKNCPTQTVIAGESKSVEDAVALFNSLGIQAVEIPVSHAFHSKMVAPVMPAYRKFLDTLDVKAPNLPITSNVSADFYPTEIEKIKDIMTTQIMSSVEWVKQVELAYKRGVRLFIECGPKRVLSAFVTNTLADKKDIRVLASNHPKRGGITEFNDLMANLAAAGISVDWSKTDITKEDTLFTPCFKEALNLPKPKEEKTFDLNTLKQQFGVKPVEEKVVLNEGEIVISGVGAKVFGADLEEVLQGKSLVKELSEVEQQKQLDKNITAISGEKITTLEQVIKNYVPAGIVDLTREFGLSSDIVKTLNDTAKMAIYAGLLALKDSNIPLNNLALPENMKQDTGIIFASSLPTASAWVYEVSTKVADILKGKTKKEVRTFYDSFINKISDETLRTQIQTWYEENFAKYEMHTSRTFTQDFLTKALPLAHTQFASLVGVTGPALHISGSGTCVEEAISIAKDWLKLGKVNRVIVIAADAPSGETLQDFLNAGFLTQGQNKVVLGAGASALMLERSQDVLKRNKKPLAKIVFSDFATGDINETLKKLLSKTGLDKEQSNMLVLPSKEVLEKADLKAFFVNAEIKDISSLIGCTFGSGIEGVLATTALNKDNYKYALRISSGFNNVAVCLQENLSSTTITNEVKAEVKKEEPKQETPKAEVKKESQNKQISEEALTKEIVDIVAEKTGYPQDMLELDLDMEADLGIDTVKQAELFALFGEKYKLPLDQGLQLKDYPTIRHCVKYVYKELSGGKTAEVKETKAEVKAEVKKEEPKPVEVKAEAPKAEDPIFEEPAKAEVVEEKEEPKEEENKEENSSEEQKLRFVPITAPAPLTPLKPRKLSAQRVVLIMSDNAPITKAYTEAFKEQGIKTHTFTTLRARTKNTTIVNWDSLEETIAAFEEFSKNNPLAVQGIIYALPCSIKKFDKRVNPNTELTKNLMPLFNVCKVFINDLKKRDDADTFVAVVSKVDGNFGYKTKDPVNPILGAVYGGAACFRKDLYEIAGVLTKIIDFSEDLTPEQMAQQTISEVLTGDERGQISFEGLERKTILCLPRKISKEVKRMDLEGKTLAFTGAARGIGSILAQKIAKQYQSRILILDIIELLDKTPYYATLGEQDLAALKQELWQKLKADTTIKATPVLLEKEFGKIKDSITLYKTIQKLKALGSEVEYYHCDVTNGSMLKDVVMKIKKKYGKLDGLIHFAGLERSKLLTDKTIEEYYKIFSVKAISAAAFLALNLVKESGFYAFASSIAGKFGNLGQSDYASASDYLAKLSLSLNRQGQRAVSIAMSAYSKVGMGVRPGVFDFLTKQGLKFVDPEVGMQIFLDEIVYGKVPEIVLTDDLGMLDTDKQICFEEPNLLEEDIVEEDSGNDDNNSNNTPSVEEKIEETPKQEEESVKEELTQEEPKKQEEPKTEEQGELFSLNEEPQTKQEDTQSTAEVQTEEKDNFFLGQIVSLIKNQELLAKKTYRAAWTFLKDHSINGTPYIPGVMGIESFVEAAKALGQKTKGLQDVHFSLPIKLLRLRDQEVMIKAKNEQGLTSFALESDFINSRGIKMGSTRKHFKATLLNHFESLWPKVRETIDFDNLIKSASNYKISKDEIYKGMFHGPSFRVLDGIIQADGDHVLSVYKKPEEPLFDSGDKKLIANPLLIEAAFQTSGYRDVLVENRITLPDYIGSLWLNLTDKPKDNLFVLAKYTGKNIEGKSLYNTFVFDENGKLWVELQDYQMVGQ